MLSPEVDQVVLQSTARWSVIVQPSNTAVDFEALRNVETSAKELVKPISVDDQLVTVSLRNVRHLNNEKSEQLSKKNEKKFFIQKSKRGAS